MKKITLLFAYAFFAGLNSYAQTIITYGGNGINGHTGDGGAATSAEMSYPDGMGIDGTGNVYSAEAGSHYIRMINTSGIISSVAGNGTAGFSGDGGAATVAEINNPTDVTVDGAGNIYIADEHNNRVRKISTTGIITTIAGNGASGYSGDGGQATSAKLNYPAGVAVDVTGNVFIADYMNSCIREVNTSGIITTVAGTAFAGFSGDGGQATAAELNFPIGIAVNGAGELYIADNVNNRVRKVSTGGIISTVGGNGTAGYSGDNGAATSAELNWPTRVYIDALGNLLVSDWGNGCIREINTSGTITTLAGTGTQGFSGDGGPATSAELSHPTGAVVNATGDIFIDDEQNHRVRKITQCADSIIITGVTQVNIENADVKLYPNPSNGIFTISYKDLKSDNSELRIMDMFGRVLKTINVAGREGQWKMDESTLSAGIYFYRFFNNGMSVATGKFVITR